MADYATIRYRIVNTFPTEEFNLAWATTKEVALADHPGKTAAQVKSLFYKEFSKWLKQGFVAVADFSDIPCGLMCGRIEGEDFQVEMGLVCPDDTGSTNYFYSEDFLQHSEVEWQRFIGSLGLKNRVDYVYANSSYHTRRKYLATLDVCKHTLTEEHVATLQNGNEIIKLIGNYIR